MAAAAPRPVQKLHNNRISVGGLQMERGTDYKYPPCNTGEAVLHEYVMAVRVLAPRRQAVGLIDVHLPRCAGATMLCCGHLLSRSLWLCLLTLRKQSDCATLRSFRSKKNRKC